jgi:hypothetical protein
VRTGNQRYLEIRNKNFCYSTDDVTGDHEDHNRFNEGRGTGVLDERLDASLAETCVSVFFAMFRCMVLTVRRPNTILMFLFMEQLQRLLGVTTL